MNKILGFVGNGNMGRAMMGGIINAGLFKPENVIVSDINEKGLKAVKEEYGVKTTVDNKEVAKEAD
ncbi:pyrroline-5-carboxylate reductase, partial [Clostridium sp. cpc1]|uniref:pyrroline-5-carboxylate reductase family protein n=1 Tax=Clostridium sp. cpc1 TaxID=2016536 RepID=UPI00223E8FD5